MQFTCIYRELDANLSLTLAVLSVQDNGHILHNQSVVEIYGLRTPQAQIYCAANMTVFSDS